MDKIIDFIKSNLPAILITAIISFFVTRYFTVENGWGKQPKSSISDIINAEISKKGKEIKEFDIQIAILKEGKEGLELASQNLAIISKPNYYLNKNIEKLPLAHIADTLTQTNEDFHAPILNYLAKYGINTTDIKDYIINKENNQYSYQNKIIDFFNSIFDYRKYSNVTYWREIMTNPSKVEFAKEIITSAGIYFDSSHFRELISNFSSSLSKELRLLGNQINNAESTKQNLKNELDQIIKDYEIAVESTKDRMLIHTALPIFGIIIILLLIIPYLYKSNPNLIAAIIEKRLLLQIFTVFILIISILLLGIGGKLTSEVLGTLLGGISVYVLQNSLDNKRNDELKEMKENVTNSIKDGMKTEEKSTT